MGCYAPVMLACDAHKTLLFVWVLGAIGLLSESWKLLCESRNAAHGYMSSVDDNRTGQWKLLDWINLARYLLMGWAVLPILGSIAQRFPSPAVFAEVAGGFLYTGGVFFFIRDMEFHLSI